MGFVSLMLSLFFLCSCWVFFEGKKERGDDLGWFTVGIYSYPRYLGQAYYRKLPVSSTDNQNSSQAFNWQDYKNNNRETNSCKIIIEKSKWGFLCPEAFSGDK